MKKDKRNKAGKKKQPKKKEKNMKKEIDHSEELCGIWTWISKNEN